MRHFQKEGINHPIKHNGNAVPWETVARNQGVRAFDETHDAALIALLDKEADLRRNGVRRISAESYAALKKNTPSAKLTPPYEIVPRIRLHEPEAVLPKASRPSAGAGSVSPALPPAASVIPAPASVPVMSTAPTAKEVKTEETPARQKAKRGKLSDLVAKEKAENGL